MVSCWSQFTPIVLSMNKTFHLLYFPLSKARFVPQSPELSLSLCGYLLNITFQNVTPGLCHSLRLIKPCVKVLIWKRFAPLHTALTEGRGDNTELF